MRKNCIQMTLIQVDNYGPWTLSLGHQREPYLQVLQSELYAELQRLFSLKAGLVFLSRFDNMLAVTNGISVEDHSEIQQSICQLFPVTVSMGIGVGEHPIEAQLNATRALQNRGSSRHAGRINVLAVEQPLDSEADDFVQIAHIDVNDVTTLTDSISAYDAFVTMIRVHETLAKVFLQSKSLVFFAGGDNFLVVSNGLTEDKHRKILREVSGEVGLEMKAGIGIGRTASEALELASRALDRIRAKRNEMHTTPFPHTLLETKL
jgi:GTP cyclohydrolase IIa